MCASHNSEPRHIERTRAMLAKAHVTEADLRCGGHAPLSDAVWKEWIRRDFSPTGVCSNCSGKHAGMLAGAQALGAAVIDYHLPGHPLQVRVKRTVAELCDLPEDGVPLDRLARLFMKMADANAEIETAVDTTPRSKALARIYRAMTTYPELVAGDGRFCTALMQAFDGDLVGKVGADASYAIGVRATGTRGSLGIAVKVEDGNTAALYAIVTHVLAQLDIGQETQRAKLAAYRNPPMRNTMGIETGWLVVSVPLERV
jgi:L-asparaginase II